MRRSLRVLSVLASLGVLVSLTALPTHTSAARPRDDANTLTIMTDSSFWLGFTKASMNSTNTIASFYRYYHKLWEKRFPNLKINEVVVPGVTALTSKLLLAVNAGNPPDLAGSDTTLGALVARKAVQNLDSYYERDHVSASMFLPAMADYARLYGHWYAMPGASNPSAGDILYVPAFVKAAGWDPNKIPRTWDELWTATQKVTKWASNGDLERIGVPVGGANIDSINQYCGAFVTYEPKTAKFHANLPCIKDYFRYQKRLQDFYGGVTKYTKFISGDPLVWSCSKKAYIPTGKIIFAIDAYWSGGQMDTCYPVQWALSWAPTPHGTPDELRSVRTTAWEVVIPTGAKHSLLAFEFAKFTLWDNGYVAGPTTNGYVVAKQGDQWAKTFTAVEAQIRQSNHYRGNPMQDALKVVTTEAARGQVSRATDVASGYYTTQLGLAWQDIEYGRASVDQALDRVQQLVDRQQKVLHAQAGIQ